MTKGKTGSGKDNKGKNIQKVTSNYNIHVETFVGVFVPPDVRDTIKGIEWENDQLQETIKDTQVDPPTEFTIVKERRVKPLGKAHVFIAMSPILELYALRGRVQHRAGFVPPAWLEDRRVQFQEALERAGIWNQKVANTFGTHICIHETM